jgi:hypothetical protein
MKTEYRIIFTATFDTAAERDKAYDSLKGSVVATTSKAAITKRADMTKDEYIIDYPEPSQPVSEKVI